MEKALNSVIKEQPSLRSYITSDGMQCFMDEPPQYYKIEEIDVSDLPEQEQKEKLLEIRKNGQAVFLILTVGPCLDLTCLL